MGGTTDARAYCFFFFFSFFFGGGEFVSRPEISVHIHIFTSTWRNGVRAGRSALKINEFWHSRRMENILVVLLLNEKCGWRWMKSSAAATFSPPLSLLSEDGLVPRNLSNTNSKTYTVICYSIFQMFYVFLHVVRVLCILASSNFSRMRKSWQILFIRYFRKVVRMSCMTS